MEGRMVSLTKRVEELERMIGELVKWTKCPIIVNSKNPTTLDVKTGGDDSGLRSKSNLSSSPIVEPVVGNSSVKTEPASPPPRQQPSSDDEDTASLISTTLFIPSSGVDVDIGLFPMSDDDDNGDDECVPPNAPELSFLDPGAEDEYVPGPARRKRKRRSVGKLKLKKEEIGDSCGRRERKKRGKVSSFSSRGKQDASDDDYSPPTKKRPVTKTTSRGRSRGASARTILMKVRTRRKKSLKSQIVKKRATTNKAQALTPVNVPKASTTASMDPIVKMDRLLQYELNELGINLPIDIKSYEKKRITRTKCRICRVTFNLEIQLKGHLKRIHGLKKNPPTGKARTCEHPGCGKVFYYIRNYTEHLAVHSDEQPFQCDVCVTRFKSKNALVGHKRTFHSHSGPRPTKFTCEKCGTSYFTKAGFERHNLKLHPDGGVNLLSVKCQTCGLFLKDKNYLRRHVRGVHEEIRSHACHLCGRLFSQRNNLLRHIQEVDHETRKRKEKPHVKLNQGSFKCHICAQPFTNKGNMEKHVSRHLNPDSNPRGKFKQIKWVTEDPAGQCPGPDEEDRDQGMDAVEVEITPQADLDDNVNTT